MKTGYVGIIGKPNAGKSTILNALIGEKLAIVTPKAQTTRRRIIGIYSTENCQIVFIDTPGYVDNPDRFSEKLVNQAKGTMREVDVNLLIVDATKYMKSLPDDVLVQIKYCQRPVFLIINKIDKIKKSFILPIIDFYRNIFEFVEIIPLSAKYKDGVAILLEKLLEYLPEGEPIYPEDQLSSQPQRMFVEEFIREAIFNNLSEEIPYSSYVQLNSFSEADTGKVEIQADIFIEKESQKRIIIGKSGTMIKTLREQAAESIQNFLQRPVQLSLWVKIDKNWKKDESDEKL